jgi:hypothetical protein
MGDARFAIQVINVVSIFQLDLNTVYFNPILIKMGLEIVDGILIQTTRELMNLGPLEHARYLWGKMIVRRKAGEETSGSL